MKGVEDENILKELVSVHKTDHSHLRHQDEEEDSSIGREDPTLTMCVYVNLD